MKQTIKYLKKKCDDLFSRKIRSLGVCQFMGKDHVRCSSVLQCAHIETRGAHALRWDEKNALCLCSGHHFYYHNHMNDFFTMIKIFYPIQWWYVQQHKHDIAHTNLLFYKELYEKLSR